MHGHHCGRDSYGKKSWGQHEHHSRFGQGFGAAMGGMRKAPVSIYKTETTYEIMVFAPGREKENFSVNVKGDELRIAYKPTIDTSSLQWIRKEYSRGGFERTFVLDSHIESDSIAAKYENGVLQISLPFQSNAANAEGQAVKID